ncbi:hypothetical protein Tco_0562504 [Tanacetum coccineum]
MMDDQLSTRLKDSIKKSIRSYTADFEKKDKDERKRYIDLVEKSVKDIIKDEVKSQLPQILPKEVSDYATPVIQSSVTESLENIILLDKIQKSKSYRGAQEHKDLYDALVKYYKLEKDLFESYGNVYSLKRDREDKDKYEDPPAGSDQELKKRKTSKDAEPPKGYKSKDSKSSSSKGTKSQPKSLGKSVRTKELVIAQAEKPSLTFDKLMSTPIDFFAYVLNNLKVENLTQEYLVRPAFNLLKGTCKSRVELEYHFEEYQGRQVVPVNYSINNDLEYLKCGSLSRKYTTSTTKTKAAKYDTIEGIEDMVPSLWILVKVAYDKYAMWGITYWVQNDKASMDMQATGKEIVIRREDQQLDKFIEGDFPRLNLRDIEDMLLLLVQKKLSNLDKDDLYDLNVALQIFTFGGGTFRSGNHRMDPIHAYLKSTRYNISRFKNPPGIIYQDKLKRNRLICSDELYKFCDGLSTIRRVLYDIASSLEMDYLPKRR